MSHGGGIRSPVSNRKPVSPYSYVDGTDLVNLIFEVREEFLARIPYELDDTRRPNSLHLVSIDLFEEKNIEEQLAVVRDLIERNPDLIVARDSSDIFAHADTPGAYVVDLVCEVACQVLLRDPEIRAEDGRRLALAAKSAAELDESF
jgi:hypothetical protein